ncbi:MAG: DUF485 domain-containing protein [Rubrobacteraceae bacterium]
MTKASASADSNVDWAEVAQYPAFSALMSTKVRFLVPLVVISVGFYLGVTVLAGLAPGFTGQLVIGPLNVGYLLVFAAYIVAWVAALVYVHVANRDFDAMATNAISELEEHQAQRREDA